jgi:hypothetical protein
MSLARILPDMIMVPVTKRSVLDLTDILFWLSTNKTGGMCAYALACAGAGMQSNVKQST